MQECQEAQRYRKQAGQCRERASDAVDPIDREEWLRLATEMEKLAEAESKRASRSAMIIPSIRSRQGTT